jgi:hypothetical protein
MKIDNHNFTECLTLIDNHTGCFLSDTGSLFNGILSIFYILLATIILIINIGVLVIFFKKTDNSTALFLNISFVTLIFFNILSVFFTYLIAYFTCFVHEFSHFLCVFKYCVYYFIGHEINLTNFLISFERMISVQWPLEYRKLVNKITTLTSIITLSILAVGLSFFNFATYEYDVDQCICALNSILSKNYVLTNNFAFFCISIATAIIYFYIYFLVKSMKKRVEHHRKSIGSSLMVIANNSKNEPKVDEYLTNENSNVSTIQSAAPADDAHKKSNVIRKKSSSLDHKMKVLKVQTFVFCVFFCSWFPFIVLTTYEIIMGIKTYEALSKFRNFSVSFVLVNGIVTPIVYTYRLKYMMDFISNISFISLFSRNKNQKN